MNAMKGFYKLLDTMMFWNAVTGAVFFVGTFAITKNEIMAIGVLLLFVCVAIANIIQSYGNRNIIFQPGKNRSNGNGEYGGY